MKAKSGPARVLCFLIPFALFCAPSFAQKSSDAFTINDFYFETRMGCEAYAQDGDLVPDLSGFRGSWLNMRLDGQIGDRLSYSYRQRLNKATSRTFFDATDWIHLDWKTTDRLTLSAGKQVVAIGGYEYDRAPIDLYYCSEFWNNIACYQMGVSGTYSFSQKDQLVAQICNSPMGGYTIDGYGNTLDHSKLGLNLLWYGSHGFFESMWSVNAFQNGGDSWVYYIALGSRFNFTKKFRLDLDVMNRATGEGPDDWSVMGELSYAPSAAMRIHAKVTYDYNRDNVMDRLVLPGTDMTGFSGGIEYFPLKNNRDAVKLFATASYCRGDYHYGAALEDGCLRAQVGLKFRLGVLEGIRSL